MLQIRGEVVLTCICRTPVFARGGLNVRALQIVCLHFQRVLHNLLYFRSIESHQ